MRVCIVRDTCTPLWAVKCASPCHHCRAHEAMSGERTVCWLDSGLDKPRVVARCMERGWTIEAKEKAA